MPERLSDIITKYIIARGPMRVDDFIGLALAHPIHGYYMKKDPFGRGGDFTTAPEISQMFGEVIGAWVAEVWMQIGKPQKFTLLECGPGRGTLMADMLRAGSGVAGFKEAVHVHLLEISPALKAKQRETLTGYNVTWHEDLSSVPRDVPVIVIANEFFDALPIRQFEFGKGQWRERAVALESGEFTWTSVAAKEQFKPAKDGDIFEISPLREACAAEIFSLLKQTGGAALFIDYGHAESGYGDTLQAMHKNAYCDVLDHIGDADLTSHVDFEALGRQAQGLKIFGAIEQGRFLERLGIASRATYLLKKADAVQAADINAALYRLTHRDEMGALFKVMGFSSRKDIQLAGF